MAIRKKAQQPLELLFGHPHYYWYHSSISRSSTISSELRCTSILNYGTSHLHERSFWPLCETCVSCSVSMVDSVGKHHKILYFRITEILNQVWVYIWWQCTIIMSVRFILLGASNETKTLLQIHRSQHQLAANWKALSPQCWLLIPKAICKCPHR